PPDHQPLRRVARGELVTDLAGPRRSRLFYGGVCAWRWLSRERDQFGDGVNAQRGAQIVICLVDLFTRALAGHGVGPSAVMSELLMEPPRSTRARNRRVGLFLAVLVLLCIAVRIVCITVVTFLNKI